MSALRRGENYPQPAVRSISHCRTSQLQQNAVRVKGAFHAAALCWTLTRTHHRRGLSSPKRVWLQATFYSTCRQSFTALTSALHPGACFGKAASRLEVCAVSAWQTSVVVASRESFKGQAQLRQRSFTTGYNQVHFLHDWAQGFKEQTSES